jgi:putative flippase GtrA
MLQPTKNKSLVKKAFKNQFFRFILVSGINTMFGFMVFSFFIFLGFYYPVAVLFSTILGILFNFQTVGRFVFFSKNSMLIFRFMTVYAITYLLSTAGIGALIRLHMGAYTSGAIFILPIGIISFFLNKKIVFREEQDTFNQ